MPLESPALIGSREAARYLGISERTLHRMKQAGEIPFVPLAGKTIRYRPEALAAWAAGQERTNNPATDAR